MMHIDNMKSTVVEILNDLISLTHSNVSVKNV